MRSKAIVLFIIALAALAIGLRALPVAQWIIQVESYVRTLGPLGPALWVLLYVICTVLFVPGSALTVSAGGLFGFTTGFFIVLIGANVGALCAFLLSRSFLRARVVRWAEHNPKFRALDRAVGAQGFKMVFLSRLSPAFPFSLLNYLLGVTAVRTGAYVPFGGGSRTCIGMRFGQLEVKTIARTILDRFRLELAEPAREVSIRQMPTLSPRGGLPVGVR
mgnify:CR=1 FL=1